MPILVLLFLLCSLSCWAQVDSLKVNQLAVGMDFLTHGETCGGGLPKSTDGTESVEDRSSFLLGRFRLNIDYSRSWLQAHAVIQNNAVWGSQNNTALKLYESWVKVTAKCGLFAQVGRVALSYDDERIIGPNDFAAAALSHDVLRVGYEGYGHRLHAFVAYNQNSDDVYADTYYADGAQDYKTMQTVWYHYDIPKFPLGASLLFMNIGLQAGQYVESGGKKVPLEINPPRTEYQQLFGGYLNFHSRFLTLEGSYYRQRGQVVNAKKEALPVKAWMASAKATVSPTDHYGFELGYDYLSGDDYVPVVYGGMKGLPRHAELGGFTPLYGSRNTFYGIMDFFYQSAYIRDFTPGLQKAFAGVFCSPTGKFDCKLSYHYLAVTTDLASLNRTLGHCIDLQATYRFTKDIALYAGYTQMMGTETVRRLKQDNGSEHAQWGWFSLVISPSLFTTRW